MAEINSRQAAKLAAGRKLTNAEAGRVRNIIVQTPASFSQLAIDDTLAGGQLIPKGSRILSNTFISCAAGTASSTIDIGLRNFNTKAVVDATAIATGIDTAAAGVKQANNGTKMAAGAEYVLDQDCEVYITAKGAVLAANQQIRIEISYQGA